MKSWLAAALVVVGCHSGGSHPQGASDASLDGIDSLDGASRSSRPVPSTR